MSADDQCGSAEVQHGGSSTQEAKQIGETTMVQHAPPGDGQKVTPEISAHVIPSDNPSSQLFVSDVASFS